jgi:hypothetical protein
MTKNELSLQNLRSLQRLQRQGEKTLALVSEKYYLYALLENTGQFLGNRHG